MEYTKGIRRIFVESYCNKNFSSGRYYRNQMNQGSRQREMQNAERQRQNMCNGNAKGVEVDCVCKVSSARNCHRNDPMEKLGERFPLVMAYIPWQQWGELYDADDALVQGTLFKDLNQIFCGVRC